MIDEITKDKVKDAANVVDVIGHFYELKNKGQGKYHCLCPFHEDRHMGSFVVDGVKNFYHCYSCGANGDSLDFLMEHERMKFPEALAWLGAMYGIPVEGSDKCDVERRVPHKPAPKLPTLEIELAQVKAQKQFIESTNLVKWLRSLPWSEEQRANIDLALKQYCMGGTKDGMAVFWQIDEEGKVHTAKVMRYGDNGHRAKEGSYNSDWMHSMLERAGRVDLTKFEKETVLFGRHLSEFQKNASIYVVESEKTALMAAIYFNDWKNKCWMATGGKHMISKRKLQRLLDEGRHVFLIPDVDAIDTWKQFAKDINHKCLHVAFDTIESIYQPCDGEKADLGDVIERWLATPKESELDKMRKASEPLNILIDKLELVEI